MTRRLTAACHGRRALPITALELDRPALDSTARDGPHPHDPTVIAE